jgi:hypothetical protein
MNKWILSLALLISVAAAPTAQAHWGWHGGHGHWHGGWHGHWHGHSGWHGHWHGGGLWNAGWGWNGGWGWGGGWGPSVWTRRTVVFVRPSPVYYSSPVIYGDGCGWYGGAPAVYAPAGIAYGPDAMKEFMGVDRDFAKGDLVAPRERVIVAAPALEGARVVADEPLKKERVASRPEAKARAEQFISFGDSQFGEQQYHSAAQRYREAAVAAPDVADAHFRQGFAYIASNRIELAAKSFRRGLALDPLWVNSSFRIDSLYGRNQLAKDAHLEGLARGALADRDSADHLFLIGLMLHFDGQGERAKKFFTQAEKRTAGDAAHIEAFLVPAAPAAEDAV